jgi:hypothetical protein
LLNGVECGEVWFKNRTLARTARVRHPKNHIKAWPIRRPESQNPQSAVTT